MDKFSNSWIDLLDQKLNEIKLLSTEVRFRQ